MALTKEQLAIRKIGGSDLSTLLGLNPFKTALELYYEKTGALEPIDLSENEAVEAGNVLEDGIAALAERRMSRRYNRPIKLRRSNLTIVHPKYDWLTVHIDRDVVGEERGVEIKNVGWRAAPKWGAEDTDDIPTYYKPQPHVYMLVKDYPVWTVAAYLGGGELRLYEMERNQEWDEIIIDVSHDFWFNNVVAGVPPALDLTAKRAVEALKRVYPGTNGETIVAGPELLPWRDVRTQAKEKIEFYKKVVDGADAHILDAMGGNAILSFADGAAFTRKLTQRKAYAVEATSYIDFRYKKKSDS